MSSKLATLFLSASAIAGTAAADAPRVAVDIAPVHSLVARVMDGVGNPDLIVPPGASPHEYSLRPSEAAALQDAELVFWIGEDLTPWMADAVANLADDATVTSLMDADGVKTLPYREDALFEAHAHGDDDHDEHGHDDHDHDDHDEDKHAEGDDHDHDHDHAKEASHDDHDHDHDKEEDHAHDHDDHAHGEFDVHGWLSPDNAAVWLNAIAAKLSAADPDNAGAYFANAAAGRAELDALKSEIGSTLDPARGKDFIVFHDAYQYFEVAFDFPAAGAISLSDASDPSPARIAEIQDRIRDEGIDCVLAEPQYNPGLVATVLDGTDAKTGVVDPLGAELTPGPALYPQLLRNMARSLADCL